MAGQIEDSISFTP